MADMDRSGLGRDRNGRSVADGHAPGGARRLADSQLGGRRVRAAMMCALAMLISQPGEAQLATVPGPGPGDPRIKEFLYDTNAIVEIRGQLGYELMIEFGPDELIENVSIGDSLSWQVTPNRRATLLFLKPTTRAKPTSMTVVTDQRIYSFLLRVAEEGDPSDPQTMLRLRFLYPPPPVQLVAEPPPPPPPPPPPQPEDFNFDYAQSGAKTLYPVRVFDDGFVTYFQFDPAAAAPAIFVIGADGKEEMANTRIEGDYTVAELIAEKFILRYGRAQAELRNRAWSKRPRPEPAPLPQPSRGG
jgi:type IV secretion system protein VirB9